MSIQAKISVYRISYRIFPIILLLCFFAASTTVFAELKLESVYPTLGELGQGLDVTLKGAEFDQNTRVAMYLDVGNQRMSVGSASTPHRAYDVVVSGSFAYVADGNSGFQVIDIRNSSNPQIIGSVDTPGSARSIVVLGDYAYVADYDNGLQVINISSAANPYIAGSVDTPGYASGVAVSGNYAYIADEGNGLQVIDISSPSSPQLIGDGVGYQSPNDVAVSGNYAYMAIGASGLQVIDISDPLSPFVTGSVDTTGSAFGVAVSGNYAYLASYQSGLHVIDISNPSSPQVEGSVDTPGEAKGVAISGNYAHVADSNNGFHLIDISNGTNPCIKGSVDTPGSAKHVTVSGSYAYVADYDGGLQIIDVSNLSVSQITGFVDTPGYASGVAVSGNHAYVADWANGLQVIDVSNSSSPQLLGDGVDIPGEAIGVAISGDYAYVANRSQTLPVIDISIPSNPQLAGDGVATLGEARGVAVSGSHAYVAVFDQGLQVFNISDPANPQAQGHVNVPGSSEAIAVSGTYAYIASDRLRIINISNPSNPQLIGDGVELPGNATGVAVSGSHAYVSGGSNGLYVIDISNVASPYLVDTVDTPYYARGVFVSGTHAYVADGGSGVQVVDISTPSSPRIVGSMGTPGIANFVFVTDSYVYVAEGLNGLAIVPPLVEIVPVTVIDDTEISVTLSSPVAAGHYTLRLFDSSRSNELSGAVSFSEDVIKLNSKAIIVAGGGPDAPGGIWTETMACANKAYDVLIQQGFDHESIYYLSMETGNAYVDNASLENHLNYAISTWAGDGNTSELLLYFVDHGEPDHFILYATGGYSEKLSVQDLDAWLDDLQNGPMTGPVTLVYDACESGSFVSKLQPPAGRVRHVITSASNEPAYFLDQGNESFSFQFWDKIYVNAGNVGAAFSHAGNTMQAYQTALIDADGNGIANEDNDLNLAEDNVIKRGGSIYLPLHPYIGSISVGDLSGVAAEISASGVIDADSVLAHIIPPDINSETSGIPITDLPSIELTDPDGDGVYTGVFDDQGDHDGFDKEGTYLVIVKAQADYDVYSYIAGSMTTQSFYSSPLYTSVTQTSGLNNIDPDGYEEDDTFTQASVIFINDVNTQSHNFHDVGDEDWGQFYGTGGITYKIKADNLSVVCDAILEIFNADGTPRPEGPQNNVGAGQDEFIDWFCPSDGLYYVKVTNAGSTFGENVRYNLSVYLPVAGMGTVVGQVKDSSNNGIDGVRVESNIGGVFTYTYAGGWYCLIMNSGVHILTATKSGFVPQQLSVTVQDGNYHRTNDLTLPPEDTTPPIAFLTGTPSGIVALNAFEITVGGEDVVQYRFKLDDGIYGSATDVGVSISLNGLTEGFHTLYVIGKDSADNWQEEIDATTASWEVACKGNINGEGMVDLIDAVIALKVLAGVDVTGEIRADYATSGADVNNDNKVGIEEVIYILQKAAGMRSD